jgi:hypothetical protein
MRLTPLNSEVILQPVAAKDKVQPVHRLTAPFATGWVRPCRGSHLLPVYFAHGRLLKVLSYRNRMRVYLPARGKQNGGATGPN